MSSQKQKKNNKIHKKQNSLKTKYTQKNQHKQDQIEKFH